MKILKKYAAVLLLVTIYPAVQFIALNFILNPDDDIYTYIPQESDFVVEINTKNFVAEMAYQRIFREEYFLKKVYPVFEEEEGKQKEGIHQNTGIDLFNKLSVRIGFRNEITVDFLVALKDFFQVYTFMKTFHFFFADFC